MGKEERKEVGKKVGKEEGKGMISAIDFLLGTTLMSRDLKNGVTGDCSEVL